jgi:catechol 2,3-dioxygenase-like lactoylglutathione lyase family enzyme
MSKIKLEHYNLMTKKLRETVDFYSQVLGLYEGFYPIELGPGAWLYDSTDTPVVHMQEVVERERFDKRIASTSGRIRDNAAAKLEYDNLYGSGTIDHIAFSCEDIEGFKGRLGELGVPFGETGVASAAVRQLFLRDPNGIVVELNFRD